MEYLILDDCHGSLTRAVLRNPPTAPVLEFEIPEKDIKLLEGHVDIECLGFDEHSPSFAGKITRRRGNRIAVQRGEALEESSLDALRAPYFIDGFVYPVSGEWTGRASMQTKDLSCGGVSFTCKSPLAKQEVVEIALAVREGAMVIPAKIVKISHNPDGSGQFVAKFISGVEEVEQMIRKEVMFLQLKQRDNPSLGKGSREVLRLG